MDRASSLIFPGGRTLAGWWRQLAPLQPTGFWIGYAFLHRIEAPVHVLADQPVEPFAHLILQALALEESIHSNHVPGVDLARLQERLQLPAVVVQHVLASLRTDGLLAQPVPSRWQLSAQGQDAATRGVFPIHVQKRRVFPFLERLDPAGLRVAAPHFVPIVECAGPAWPVDDAHRFDVATLRASIRQPLEEKRATGFPLDVEALAEDPAAESWQQVVVDRPERLMMVLIELLADAKREVRGFAAKVDGWTLHDRTPVLRVAAPGTGLWPELARALPAAACQEAWRSWCRQRQLPASEVDACILTHQAPRLEVQAPPRLVQRLQAAKSDLFKGEAWLLVGDGYLRTAVQLAIV